MNRRFTVLALLLTFVFVGSAEATDRLVDPSALGAIDAGDCSVTPCVTVGYALSQALQGDTVVLAHGHAYAVSAGPNPGPWDITESFVTIRSSRGSDVAVGAGGRFTPSTPGALSCDGSEACIDVAGNAYAFRIQANNVTIEGIEFLGDADDGGASVAWAAVVIEGDVNRWTVRHNVIHNFGQIRPGHPFNHAFGVYADAQSTSGSVTMTGGEVRGNSVYDMGGVGLAGANVTAGVGVHVEGTSGDPAKCNIINKFACGAWIHENTFFDLVRGLNQDNFNEFVDGREPAIGVRIVQDAENQLPNNGGRVEGNTYAGHTPDGDDLDIGVFVDVGNTDIVEDNGSFSTTLAYVHNAGRKAKVDELALAPFWKTLNPNPQSLLGPDSDAYFSSQSLAQDNSADGATIVNLAGTLTPGLDPFDLTVFPGGESTSYKVGIELNGDFSVREGARVLFAGDAFDPIGPSFSDGIRAIVLNGTAGDDLLTIDFNNGNPIPNGLGSAVCKGGVTPLSAICGLEFNGEDGFDRVVLRGSEQVTKQAYVMGNWGSIPGVSSTGSGSILFEYDTLFPQTITAGTTTIVNFLNIEPIDDVIITNGAYSVLLPPDTDNEVNVIDGPTVFGRNTFRIGSGADPTFELINFRNKKDVRIYGSDDTGGVVDGQDVFTVFTPDGDAPDLLQTLRLFGGQGGGASDDYFVVRPSKDFDIIVDGISGTNHFFLDCADVGGACDPDLIPVLPIVASPTAVGAIAGFETVTIDNIAETAFDYETITDFRVSKTVNTFGTAHPGDVITFTVTVENLAGTTVDLDPTSAGPGNPLWVTDVTDHRFSLNEQSIVVDEGTVDVTGNRNMLWRLDSDQSFNVGEVKTMTYDVIVNTLITTDEIANWATLLNDDDVLANNVDSTSVELDRVFGFPAKAAIQASVFAPTDAGPRYIVGLFGGALDPGTLNIGAVMCRVPGQNRAAGWDGGLGNLWYSCGEGLPAKEGLFSPLVVTDLFRDQSGRIWLTTWGFGGLYYSDDDGKTWTDPFLDLTGGPGGSPDGVDDPFAQVYAISEDINGTLFISANNGEMYRSFDRGGTWQKAKQLPLGSADTPWSLEADPTTPGKLYAGTFGDSLYVTSDFGETWQRPKGNGLGNGHIFDIEFDPVTGNLFVGTALGVYYTADEGDNWTGLNTAFPEPNVPPEVRHVSFDENGVFFAGTWGQGVWVSPNWQGTALTDFALKAGEIADISFTDEGVYVLSSGAEMFRFDPIEYASSVDTEEPGVELPRAYSLNQNYPNPFGAQTTIQFSIPAAQDVRLEVYDVLGRRVSVLHDGGLPAGQHEVRFEAPNLTNGMYLYRLTTPGGSVTKSMVLLR